MVWAQVHSHWTTNHRGEQHSGHGDTDNGESSRHVPSPSRRLDRGDGERHKNRKHYERDDEVDPQRCSTEPSRQMALKAQPDDPFDELVRAEKDR